MRRSPRKAKRSLDISITSTPTKRRTLEREEGQFDDAEITEFKLESPPSNKRPAISAYSKSPGSLSNSSVDSMASDGGPEPLELPSFTPAVKCALRENSCDESIWNMVSVNTLT